jgi:pSer/pThr/pTyr-binding forkhead associated (FHA) protein
MAHYGNLIVTAPDGTQQTVGLDQPTLTFGRERDNDLHLDDAAVSRHHGRIECDERGCKIVDLDSINGIVVNGRPTKRATLKGNEIILVGRYQLFFISRSTPVLAAPPPGEAEPQAAVPDDVTIIQKMPVQKRRFGGVRLVLVLILLVLVIFAGLYFFGDEVGIVVPFVP